MKKFLIALGMSLTAGSAIAADAIIYEPAPVAPFAPVVYDWTGVYLGVQGGYSWTDISALGETVDFNGGLVGAHVGANWQSGAFVLGLEGDIEHAWNDVTRGITTVGTDWQGSLRVRAGYALDRTLIYATGGLAVIHATIDVNDPILGALDATDTLTGYTVGGGVEHAFADNWTGRVEYRYADFGSNNLFDLGDSADVDQHAVRVGLSYKF